mgnify:CR=1 FL=1
MIEEFISSLRAIDILLVMATGLALFAFQIKGRRKMLSYKLIADIIYATYLFLLGGLTGAVAAGIATLGGAAQVATPPHLAKKTMPYRFVFACILSAIGAYYLSRTLTDTYPLFAVVISRVVELFESTLIIRTGFFVGAVLWLIYNYDNGFYVAMIGTFLMILSMIFGFIRNERCSPKDPVP